ncbi:MAG: alpha/beta fold hydrolase [Pseudomonadota bacterium]
MIRSGGNRFLILDPKPMASVRIVCFPVAGSGGTIFSQWSKLASQNTEIIAYSPPGRDLRSSEPPTATWDDLVEDAVNAVSSLPFKSIALYGHSMGGLLSAHVADQLRKQKETTIKAIGIGGFPGPLNHQFAIDFVDRIANREGEELLAIIEETFGHLPESMANNDIRALTSEHLTVDLQLLPVSIPGRFNVGAPIVAAYGDADPFVSDVQCAQWSSATSDGTECVSYSGGHFDLISAGQAIIPRLERYCLP